MGNRPEQINTQFENSVTELSKHNFTVRQIWELLTKNMANIVVINI